MEMIIRNFSMQPLWNLSIKLRLTLGYTVMTCLLLLVACVGIQGEASTQANLDKQVDKFDRLTQLAHGLLDAANVRAVSARNVVLAEGPEDVASEIRHTLAAHEQVSQKLHELDEYLRASPDATVELREGFDRLVKTEAAYGVVALEITKLGGTGQQAQATRLINQRCKPLLNQLISQIDDLLTESARISRTAADESRRQFEAVRATSIALAVMALVLSLTLAFAT